MNLRVVSPSGVIDPSLLDNAILRLQEWGIHVDEGEYARAQWGRFAGNDEQRLADLNRAIDDSSIDMVLCARGGYGMQRLINRVHAITKPVVGFSDITELHLKAALEHQPTLHAGMCKSIAIQPNNPLQPVLLGNDIQYSFSIAPDIPFREGNVIAPVVGGNLSVIYGLQATPYSIEQVISRFDVPPILLIEDIAERHYHIDRMMRNLRLSGVLERIGGLIVGQFTQCENDSTMPCDILHTIWEQVADYDYPVAMDFPIGHGNNNLPLWLHTATHFQVKDGEICVEQSSPIKFLSQSAKMASH